MTVLLETLKKLGLTDKDIQTSNYSVYTERVTPPTPGAEVSADQMIYHVTNQVDVIVRDVNQLGDVLDKAVESGMGIDEAVTAALNAGASASGVVYTAITEGYPAHTVVQSAIENGVALTIVINLIEKKGMLHLPPAP